MRYDIIIVGGGLVGASLALALSDTGLKLALIDARVPSNNDPRLFALNNSSCQFLQNLGVWNDFADNAAPIHQVHVSYQGRFGSVRLDRADVGATMLGHVIPAYLIETALNKALDAISNKVTIYRPAKLESIRHANGVTELDVLERDKLVTLEAAIVIGADGTESTVRQTLGINADTIDYQQAAIVTRTVLSRQHQQIAYERFNKKGAIAMLPLPGNESATIWTTDKEHAESLLALSDDAFLSTLQTEFGYRLGRFVRVKERFTYPLRMLRSTESLRNGVFLLGNAAHTMHPIAAQGLNLSLYEVAVLVEILQQKRQESDNISIEDLCEVKKRIDSQQSASIGVSHRLSQWLLEPNLLMSALLPFGMIGFDRLSPAKKLFIEKMLGRTGRVPRLLLNANGL